MGGEMFWLYYKLGSILNEDNTLMSNPEIFRLDREIHAYAHYILSDQLNKLGHPLPWWTGTYRAVNSLSCAHGLLRIRIKHTYIPLDVTEGQAL